jgi:hypothetical protein
MAQPQISGSVDLDAGQAALCLISVARARGDDAMRERCVEIAEQMRESAYVDLRFGAADILAHDALERGNAEEALRLARGALATEGISGEIVSEGYALAVDAAIALGDERTLDELAAYVGALPPARAAPLLRAGCARVLAELAHRHGEAEAAERHEEEAIRLLRAVSARPMLARALLERARRRDADEALVEARTILAELGAARWLARIDATTTAAA